MLLDPRLDAPEAALLAAVSADELMDLTAEVSAEVRLSGSPEELRALERAEARLRAWGFRTRMLRHDAYISLPGPASLAVAGVGALECITHAFAVSTPPEGMTAEVVDLGAGAPADWAAADVRGRIALVDGLATPEMARRARLAGSAGQIFINGAQLHEMILSPVWGSPTAEELSLYPQAPAASVRAADGARIRAALAAGPAQATLVTTVETGWRTLPLLQADLDGPPDDRSFVLFAGHIDSWHYGAMDNGSANATMLHLSRLLAERRDQLRRGLRVCFWSGHSHGRYAGSAWYVDSHWDELRRRCAAYVNIDSVGGQGATLLTEGYCMAETFGLGREVIGRYGGQEYLGGRVGRAGDESLVGVGVPALLMTVSEQPATGDAAGAASVIGGRSGGLGRWWHTPDDTLDKLDPALLARDARLYAATIFRLCAEPLLPLDYAAAAAELDDLVAGYQARLGERFDLGAARAQSQALRAEAAALEQSLGKLREGMVAYKGDPSSLADLNAGLMALGRATIPLNYTAAGPFGHDTALAVPPLPLLAAADALAAAPEGSDAARHAAVGLRRGLNQVAFGLEAARAAVARVHAVLGDL
ncbi:M28 family peptidase [Oscillochloris sp. ZM17-4]|uniref:M28 family metallopeptidase n=1 Tax=Oscillochloris sp. ZM17-4 TaxID=2866714 RepID=UPI001C72B015|nr:M28 family peptidase [Oscillochloris sp. ZM17-4]MBX0329018.1 M28 family peptidase [Oscillochloris sp. ZM17-4]